MRILGSEGLLRLTLRSLLGGVLGYVWYLVCEATCGFLELAYGGVENIPIYHAVGLLVGLVAGMGTILYHSVGKKLLDTYRARRKK